MDRRQMVFIAGAGVLVVVLALVAWLATRGGAPATPTASAVPTATLPEPGGDTTESNTTPINANANQPATAANAAPNAVTLTGPQVSAAAVNAAADVYLDDRSGPAQLVSSFVNALNRKEYLRAYSYFENPDALGAYPAFAQGYANTLAVRLTTGTVTSNAGAGQIYYNVPITFKVDIPSGKQTFVGCYKLHISQPAVQATPPFHPLAIQSISVQQVNDNADTAALMGRACA